MTTITEVYPIPKRGGARPNSGPKSGPKDDSPDAEPSAYEEYSRNRARNEAAKADIAELDYKIKAALYVERAAVRQAAATAFALVAQSLRSIPDNLERKMAVSPDVSQEVSEAIDAALSGLSETLEMMSGPDE